MASNLESKVLTAEQKAHVLNEVERERRKILVCQLYEEGMKSANDNVRKGIAKTLDKLADIDIGTFVRLFGNAINSFNLHEAEATESFCLLAKTDPDCSHKVIEMLSDNRRFMALGNIFYYSSDIPTDKFDTDFKKSYSGKLDINLCQRVLDNLKLYESWHKIPALTSCYPRRLSHLGEKIIQDRGIRETITQSQSPEEVYQKNKSRYVDFVKWKKIVSGSGINPNEFIRLCEKELMPKHLYPTFIDTFYLKWMMYWRASEHEQIDINEFEREVLKSEAIKQEQTSNWKSMIQHSPVNYLIEFRRVIKETNPFYDFRRGDQIGLNFLLEDEFGKTLGDFASTIEDDTLAPIEDEEYQFIAAYLNSKCVINTDGTPKDEESIITELKEFVRDSNRDYQRLIDVLNFGEATSVKEIEECASKYIPGYIIVRKIKESNFGNIYKAQDTNTKKFVVLKEIKEESLSEHGRKILSKRGLTLTDVLRSEGKASIFELNHPHILPQTVIYDKNSSPLVAMKYYDQTLAEMIKQRGPLPLEEAIKYALQITAALTYCHQHKIIHEDLHEGNIGYIESEGSFYLADFGLSRKLKEQELADKNQTSERGFAPRHTVDLRIIEGKDSDYQSDVYSMGCLIYFMLVGKYPFSPEGLDKDRTSQASAFEREAYAMRIDYKNILDNVLDHDLKRILMGCWHSDLNCRYKDAEDLLLDLQKSVAILDVSYDAVAEQASSFSYLIPSTKSGYK